MPTTPLTSANGKIGPTADLQHDVDAFLSWVEEHPHEVLGTADPSALPSACMDGRPPKLADDTALTPPITTFPARAAGATLTSAMMQILMGTDTPTPDSIAAAVNALATHLEAEGIPVGTHTDTHCTETTCGCGAIDHVDVVLQHLVDDLPVIEEVMGQWGVTPAWDGEALQTRVTKVIDALPEPLRISEALSDHCQNGATLLLGDHMEVGAIINDVPGTTVDPRALTAAMTKQYLGGDADATAPQFFDIDLWALRNASEYVATLDGHPAKAERYLACACAFNIAALLALGTPALPLALLCSKPNQGNSKHGDFQEL